MREEGYQSPDANEQRRREENLTQDVIGFDDDMQKVLVIGTYDICARRGWQFYGAGNDPTHTHALLGSTAERVVQYAPCPMLVVRENQNEFI